MLDFKLQKQELTFKSRIVMGVTKFQGEVEGNVIDNCTVLVAANLNEESGNAMGFGIARVNFGTSVRFDEFRNLEFPCVLELAFATVTNSKGQTKDILKGWRVPKTGADSQKG
ncbi:hypothetical protein QEO94_07580 [Kingella negevensis]|uniref:hypothetical protein n=1 Tax=Kingella negevensis TaxID=1522312 RepID=UPI0025438682|nr:hypothetical protein [Kingella negevensis]WII92502.1 hypothetical protein QEO94_07580 [Kingella negevensis]